MGDALSPGRLDAGTFLSCAALDRQHPRDLFDIKYLLSDEGFSDEVRQGFLFCPLRSDRPMNEVLVPNFQDQRLALANQPDAVGIKGPR